MVRITHPPVYIRGAYGIQQIGRWIGLRAVADSLGSGIYLAFAGKETRILGRPALRLVAVTTVLSWLRSRVLNLRIIIMSGNDEKCV